jgi:hypothetical protein
MVGRTAALAAHFDNVRDLLWRLAFVRDDADKADLIRTFELERAEVRLLREAHGGPPLEGPPN